VSSECSRRLCGSTFQPNPSPFPWFCTVSSLQILPDRTSVSKALLEQSAIRANYKEAVDLDLCCKHLHSVQDLTV
jgi:hypothetical protein